MIGEAWATGCVDASISLEWMQCEQIPIPVPRPGGGYVTPGPSKSYDDLRKERYYEQALAEDQELIEMLTVLLTQRIL